MWGSIRNFLSRWEGKAVLAAVIVAGTATFLRFRHRARIEEKTPTKGQNVDTVSLEILEKDFLLQVFKEIRERYSKKVSSLRTASRAKRRMLSPDSAEYRRCVLDFSTGSHHLLSEISCELFAEQEIQEELVDNTLRFYEKDKGLEEAKALLMEPINTAEVPEFLSPEQLKEVLSYFETHLVAKDDDNIDELLVETAKVEDQVKRIYDLESEQVAAAAEKYKDTVRETIDKLSSQTRFVMQQTADDSFDEDMTGHNNEN